MRAPKLVLAGVEDGACPCTGPECAQPRVEFGEGGQFEVHHPDPERARAIARTVGELYAELVNDAVERLSRHRLEMVGAAAVAADRWRDVLELLADEHCADPACPPCVEWHRRKREEVIPDG